jgi:hypothetical protein
MGISKSAGVNGAIDSIEKQAFSAVMVGPQQESRHLPLSIR